VNIKNIIGIYGLIVWKIIVIEEKKNNSL